MRGLLWYEKLIAA